MTAQGSLEITAQELEGWATGALSAAGADAGSARTTAQCLVEANMRGRDTHGVVLLRLYLPRLASGAIDGRARPRVERDLPAAAVVDGRNALGPVVACFALDRCCDKASAAGAAVVLTRCSNHFGAASCYSERAARKGFAAIVLSNSDPGLAPYGALGPVLGTNPLAIAAPAPDGGTLPSLDIATSVVALGRIRAAIRAGEQIPAGWAIGRDGHGTCDPEEALLGSMLPLGGYKGFGLAFMLDVLAGCLSGAAVSPDIPGDPEDPRPQETGHFFLAVDVAAVREQDGYSELLQVLEAAVHRARRAEGAHPLLVPGEPEARTEAERLGRIPIDGGTVELLASLGAAFGVPFPGRSPAPGSVRTRP